MCGPMLCQVDGKRWCRMPVPSTASGRKINHLFHLDDATPNYRFLVDSGAEVSVVPPSPAERLGKSSRSLVAANGSTIPCFGTKNVQLKIGSQKYNWDFQFADVKQPLLGADFLRHSGLLVDVRGNRLVDTETFSSVRLRRCSTRSGNETALDAIATADDCFGRLLAEFPSITEPKFLASAVDHGVRHFIPTTCAPIRSKARRLAPDKLAAAKAEFETMLDHGDRPKVQWPMGITARGR